MRRGSIAAATAAQTSLERDLVERHGAVLRRLHPSAVVGHARGAVEPRRDRARADGVLVDVHHLRLANGPRGSAAMKDAATSPALSGVVANTPECILTPVGMPRIGRRVADDVVDVTRGAVAAGEQDQVDPAAGELRRGSAGVVGGRVSCVTLVPAAESPSRRRRLRPDRRPSRRPRRRGLRRRTRSSSRASARRLARRRSGTAPSARACSSAPARRFPSAHPAAHAGDRVDDQPEARHRVRPRSATRPRPRRRPAA